MYMEETITFQMKNLDGNRWQNNLCSINNLLRMFCNRLLPYNHHSDAQTQRVCSDLLI